MVRLVGPAIVALAVIVGGCSSANIVYWDNFDGLRAVEPDGTHDHAIETDMKAAAGRWSPDGTRIAFGGWSGDSYDIYTMNEDGSNLRHVTATSESDWGAAWSPNGDRIAFQRVFEGDGGAAILIVDLADLSTNRLTTPDVWPSSPDWSPDGSLIAFTDGRGIGAISPDDAHGTVQWLYRHTDHVGAPRWSPDGTHIAFARQEPAADNDAFDANIYVLSTTDGSAQQVTIDVSNDWQPTWSPDGERIGFVSNRDGTRFSRWLFVMDADGTNIEGLGMEGGLPDWRWAAG